MSEEFIAHIFEPFSREQTSTVSGIEGIGLGMAIVKKIVDRMGGTIAVKKQTGERDRSYSYLENLKSAVNL